MHSIGRYSISFLVLEHFALDGGAMFGAVPKALWSRAISSDDRNRIPLCTRVLVLDGPEGKALIDCGNGGKWGQKELDIFAIEPLSERPLRELVPDVQHVVLTHLHFDHAGGVSYRDDQGGIHLSYPQAMHYLQRVNFDRAQHPGVRERGSYLPDNVLPLLGGKLTLLDDAQEILPGVTVHRADGHTAGLQWVLIRDSKDQIAFPSDLIPTAHHLSLPWVMGYDLHAEQTMREKALFLEQASLENWLVVFEHDRDTPCGRVRRDSDGKFQLSIESADQFRFS